MRRIQRLLEEATLRGEPDPYLYIARQLGTTREATRNYILAYIYGLPAKHRQKEGTCGALASQNDPPIVLEPPPPNSRLAKRRKRRLAPRG